jgi:hypothetical protein
MRAPYVGLFLQRLFRVITRPCDKLIAVFRYAGPRPQDAGNTFAFANAIFVIQPYSAIAGPATCTERRVIEKSKLFHTNRRSGRDWGSNSGHLRGRQRR